jgi:hypothetical protein
MIQIATPCPYQLNNETWELWIQHIQEWCRNHDITATYLYVRTERQRSDIIWEIEDESHASIFTLKWVKDV